VVAKKIEVVVDPRRGERRAVSIAATAWLPGEQPVAIRIEQLSSYDLRATIPLTLEPGALIRIGLPTGSSPHALVTRIDDDLVGCKFMLPIGSDEFSALVKVRIDLEPSLS